MLLQPQRKLPSSEKSSRLWTSLSPLLAVYDGASRGGPSPSVKTDKIQKAKGLKKREEERKVEKPKLDFEQNALEIKK
jgi:hypothetical protein